MRLFLLGIATGALLGVGTILWIHKSDLPAPPEADCGALMEKYADLLTPEKIQNRSQIFNCGHPTNPLTDGEMACMARWGDGPDEYLCGGKDDDVGVDGRTNSRHDGRFYPALNCEIPYKTCPNGRAKADRIVDVRPMKGSKLEVMSNEELHHVSDRFGIPPELFKCRVHRVWEYKCI